LLGLPTPKRKKALATLEPAEALSLLYDWRVWAREAQLPPEWLKWRVCILLGGRGSGKTRAGAEWVRMMVETGKASRISLVAPTAHDARDVMVEGESGLLAVCPPWDRPNYEPTKKRLTWKNGAVATVFSADEPSRLRGPQADAAWADELAFWRYPEAWDNLLLGLRLGGPDGAIDVGPRCVVTTTPRPSPLLKDLLKRDSTHVLRSTTFDNEANLATEFIDDIIERYEGTRLGRQELYAELLTDTEGALWTRNVIEDNRVTEAPPLKRIVVAIDPAASANESSNHTGIIVAGISNSGECYVLEDATVKASPAQWAQRAVRCFHEHKADRIIAESNQGGEMVRHTIATVSPHVPVRLVHATRGKFTRAEPVAALYEQGKVHHVGGFAKLEDQLCTWTIDDPSPDRLDALVWAVSELCLNKPSTLLTF
jgi:phage terminase large subunit-like protein